MTRQQAGAPDPITPNQVTHEELVEQAGQLLGDDYVRSMSSRARVAFLSMLARRHRLSLGSPTPREVSAMHRAAVDFLSHPMLDLVKAVLDDHDARQERAAAKRKPKREST